MEERKVGYYSSSLGSHRPMASQMQTDASVFKRKAKDIPSPEQKKRKRCSPSPAASSEASLGPCAGLPPAVWQHIFLSCSLADLGRLIQVNRAFLSYLTDVSRAVSVPDAGCLRLLKSESLWASARNALSNKPPKPLPGFSELQMWQLAWSKRCQFCNKVNASTPGEKIWQKGPGETGVRIIWPFAIRACGSCLIQHSQTDASLLFSTASALRPALPFALITRDCNYIAAYTLQTAITPADVELSRYYYKTHVEDICQELENALNLGSTAAEEWSKGLVARGQECMKLVENWERWEVKYQTSAKSQEAKHATSLAPPVTATPQINRSKSPTIYAPIPATPFLQHFQTRPPTVPPPGFTPYPVSARSTVLSDRKFHDAIEAKASRKADIEQRCQQMNPPILPNVLRHMESFKASIQIPQLMNDHAWAVLRPRLLAQLEAAQQAEVDHLSRLASLPTKSADRREAKEATDRDWEESQKATREKLNSIAEEFISHNWDQGSAVTSETSPKFAADLLVHVRRTFYANRARKGSPSRNEWDQASPDTCAVKISLVLDDMKWIYDNKLRPLIEQFRKEVFLCASSDCDRNTRFYGFEGIVQHYGARHTKSFSVGSVGVAWKEVAWPEDPPFHTDPVSVRSAGISNHYSGLSRTANSTPLMVPYLPHASPAPFQYANQCNGPIPPPLLSSGALPGFAYTRPYAPPTENHSYPTVGAGAYVSQAAQNSCMPPTNSIMASSPVVPLTGRVAPDTAFNGPEDVTSSTSSYDKQVSAIIQDAQYAWKQTSSIKNLPNSLRIYILLHHTISKFHVEFNHEPKLTHVIDALSNHAVPKALKHAPGLSCKACQVKSLHQSDSASRTKLEERKTYTALNLLSHFRAQHWSFNQVSHNQGQYHPLLDWKEDMIELPSERFISGLIHAPGMDNEKLLVIATVFPRLFPTPLPKIGNMDGRGSVLNGSFSANDTNGSNYASGSSGRGREQTSPLISAPVHADIRISQKKIDDQHDLRKVRSEIQGIQRSDHSYQKQPQRDSPSSEPQQRYYRESQHYVDGPIYYSQSMHGADRNDQKVTEKRLDDDCPLSQKHMEYCTNSRAIDAGSLWDNRSSRQNGFQDQESEHDPSRENSICVPSVNRDQVHENGDDACQNRHREEEQKQYKDHHTREHQSRRAISSHGQSAADRFLDEFVPNRIPHEELSESSDSLYPSIKPSSSFNAVKDHLHHKFPPNLPWSNDSEDQHRLLGGQPFKALSPVSNRSRCEDIRVEDHRISYLDPTGRPQRAGPYQRRGQPLEHRAPSRFYRYMNIARDDAYGRGTSMSRSQSRRYEEQRRRLDQQEIARPLTDHDSKPIFSQDNNVDHHASEEDLYYSGFPLCNYVSIQDRLHTYNPPRYHFDESRGPPQSAYIDDYDQPLQEYEIIRVRDSWQPRNSYYQSRYASPHSSYAPITYEQLPPQRYSSRAGGCVSYEKREKPAPKQSTSDTNNELFEPPSQSEIKVESTSAHGQDRA